ncbi:DoxX family protein [Mucilaginibacter segetis]|uniref:DoxX family protein n=1 Tax=Mucilaginibacter segetis TaxID=2793071 RepID=A0A934UM83_9SPHI|nr:DoxX family protein [Mucilaginibacter segetis]MBK0378621.1 DoxX family protein [Mucilaginibacter segetis]
MVHAKKENTAYLLARLPIAFSMFGHGLVRMPKLATFSEHVVSQFEKTMLPAALVVPYSYALSFFELAVGVLLILGLFTRFANILGVAVMVSLIFGSCLLEQWPNVFTQIVYGAYFALLYLYADYDKYSVDYLIFRKK